MSWTLPPALSPRHVVVVAAAATLLTGGCGNNDSPTKAATVTIEAVDPAAAYPGVDVQVRVTLEPGANTTAEELSWVIDFGDGTTAPGEGVMGQSSHAYTESGDYRIRAQARAGGKTVGEAEQTITIYSPVDLTIDGVRGRPANARTGDTLTIEASLANAIASPILTPFEIEAALVPVSDPDAAPIVLGRGVVASPGGEEPVVPAGEAVTRSVTVTVPEGTATGEYYVVATADAGEVIADTDRSNNTARSSGIVRVENISLTEADLVVSNILAAPDRAFPALSRFTRQGRLANNGGADLFNVVVKTYLSIGDAEFNPDTDRLVHTSDPISIITARTSRDLPPQTIVLDEEIIPPAGEEIEVHVIVVAESADEGASEADLSNNTAVAASPIVVSDQLVDGPDLVVKEFIITPESTFLDGTLDVRAVIANEGTVDVGSFVCGMYLGDVAEVNTSLDPRVTNLNITSLPSEETLTVERTITIPALYDPGEYYIYLVCDPAGGLNEAFRSNNAAIYPNKIRITDQADVDMSVGGLSVPTTAAEGDAIEVVAQVCVTGSNASGPTTARLYRSAGTRVDFNAQPIATVNVPSVAPDTCEEVRIPTTAACDQFQERYTYGIIVDAEDRLPESDEANNARTSDSRLTVTGEFCACTEDPFEPNDRVLDAKGLPLGTTPAALCAQGTCDYYTVPLALGDSLTIANSFDPSKGVLATTLYAPGGLSVIDVDRAAKARQEVSAFLVQKEGDYVVAVCGELTSTRNLYTLDVAVAGQSPGVDVTPRDLVVPSQASFSIGSQLNLSWRVYNLGQTQAGAFDARLVVSPAATPDDPSDDQELNTVALAALNAATSRQEQAQVVLPPSLVDGQYILGVVLDPGAQLGEADVSNNAIWSGEIEVRTLCYDALEPNDSRTAPRVVTPASYNNLVACAQAKDYYQICALNGQQLDVQIQFNAASADLDMVLFDDQGNSLDSSATTASPEAVSVPYVNGDQCYTVEVSMTSLDPTAETTYSMDVALQDVDPSLRCDSRFEPNDAFDRAASLLAVVGQGQALDRCPVSDTDFYYIDLARGQTVTLRGTKAPAAQNGILRLQLYNSNRTPNTTIETGPGLPTAEIPNFTAPQAGRYYLQVTAGGNTRKVTYTLEAVGLSGADLSPTSFAIGPGTYQLGDEVRFGFDLNNLGSDAASVNGTFEVFLGTSATRDPANDVKLGDYVIPSALTGGASVTLFDRTTVPLTTIPNANAPHYLHLIVADPVDVNPTNNAQTIPIQIVP